MTAVEFLHSKYMKIFGELNPSTGKLVEIAYALEQAKEMEKEQMKNAVLEQCTKHERLKKIFEKQFEEYYNETFKSE
jgi:hypothetical protein